MPGVMRDRRIGLGRSSGSSLHPDTRDWRDRILANGGSISADDLKAVDANTVRPAHLSGFRDPSGTNHKIIDCSPLAGDNVAAAQVKLWYPTGVSDKLTLVNIVAGDYSRLTGLQLNGTNKYARTGVIPSTHLSASGGFSVVLRTDTAAGLKCDIGAFNTGTQSFLLYARNTGDVATFDAYNRTNSSTSATTKARWLCSAQGSTIRIFKNGSSIGSSAQVNAVPPTVEIYLGAANVINTGPVQYSDRIFGYYDINKGLTPAESATWDAILANTMSALGRAA